MEKSFWFLRLICIHYKGANHFYFFLQVFVFKMQDTISSNIKYKLVMGCIWLPHRLCVFVYRKCYIFLDFRVGTSYDIVKCPVFGCDVLTIRFLDNCLHDVESCIPYCLPLFEYMVIFIDTGTQILLLTEQMVKFEVFSCCKERFLHVHCLATIIYYSSMN